MVMDLRIFDGSTAHLWDNITCVAKYLQFAQKIIKTLKQDTITGIQMLTHTKLQEYRSLIPLHHPSLQDMWETMDRLKIRIVQAPDDIASTVGRKVIFTALVLL
jgi:hypothetical protein